MAFGIDFETATVLQYSPDLEERTFAHTNYTKEAMPSQRGYIPISMDIELHTECGDIQWLFPFDGGWWFGANIVNYPVYSANAVND